VQLLLADEEWAARSDRWIAEQCRVSDKTVAKIRAEREQVRKSALDEMSTTASRVGRDGKVRPASTKAPAAKSESQKPAAEPARICRGIKVVL
jgi:hypothetical protein